MPVKGRVTKKILLEGATEVLNSGTCADLTVDALARHLSMSKSTLYKHFVSKNAVLKALVELLCAQAEDDLATARGVESVVDAFARHAQRLPRAFVLEPERLPVAAQRRLTAVIDSFRGALSNSTSRFEAVALTAACSAVMRDAAGSGAAPAEAVLGVRGMFRI